MKILFITYAISQNEYNTFEKLASWMGAEIIKGGETPLIQPDIIINLGGTTSQVGMEKMGITSNPKRVYYFMGQTKAGGGWALWEERDQIFNDYFFGYGDMAQKSDVMIDFLPFPCDVETMPQAKMDFSQGIKICQSLVRFWKKSIIPYRLLKEAGKELVFITNLTKEEAINKMADYHIYIGNYNYGNLGNSEFEAMASGLCCIGYLKPEVKTMYETLGVDFPFVNITLDIFKTQIINLDQAKIIAQGKKCRDWMLANYTHQKLADYWNNKLGLL